ncbi:unnamed protein product [Rotaria magnacalcarata]|uniref:Uncharacterized protein n=2 Tax=Rotaria magnacalcarata TaxID=392030 RepID=A0A816ZTF7_9BILA|nr:unnamed protein product [Rotaria magnacalcarata]CAF2210276.1 unnamed protein product [Rotaria magnacalcarata]CAF4099031.1 unnamed protein product [Rotaria magnacalcarata]
MLSCLSDNASQMDRIAEADKIDLENSTYDEEELNHLWIQTYAYRQKFVRNSTTEDIIREFPSYSNPHRTRATPLPAIQLKDDHLNVYVDWTFICSSKSIEESIAVLIGLYSLIDLKFNTYRTAARFLYVYLTNDRQQQPSNITQRQSLSPVQQIIEINNNNDLIDNDCNDSDHDLIIDMEENEAEETNAKISTPKPILIKSTSKCCQKRKSYHLPLNIDLDQEENIPPRKKDLF